MKLGIDVKIDRSNIVVLASGVAVVLSIVLFLNIPGIRQYWKMKAELPRLQEQIKEAREMLTVSSVLDAKIREYRDAVPEYARGGNSEEKISADQVFGRIEKMAAASGIRMLENRSDILNDPASGGRQRLRLSSVFLGTLDKLRLFLIELLQQPYVLHLNELTIEAGQDGFQLKLQFVVEIS